MGLFGVTLKELPSKIPDIDVKLTAEIVNGKFKEGGIDIDKKDKNSDLKFGVNLFNNISARTRKRLR